MHITSYWYIYHISFPTAAVARSAAGFAQRVGGRRELRGPGAAAALGWVQGAALSGRAEQCSPEFPWGFTGFTNKNCDFRWDFHRNSMGLS